VRQSESIAKLTAAMVEVHRGLQPVKKDTKNPFFNSMYADLGAIIDASRPLLSKNGLAPIQIPGSSRWTHAEPDKDGNPVNYGVVALTTILLHESGEWIAEESEIPCRFGDPQRAMAAWTYLRRGAMQALVGIAAEDDDDGNAAARGSHASQERRSAPPTGDDTPICGLCHAPGVVRESSKGGKFWGCSKYGETKCKGQFPKYVDPEDQSILDNEPPASEESDPDPATLDLLTAISDRFNAMKKRTKAQRMLVFHKWAGEFMDPVPETWEKLSPIELESFLAWMGEAE